METETFRIEKGFVRMFRFAPWVFAGAALLSLTLAWLPMRRAGLEWGFYALGAAGFLFFTGFAWYGFRFTRRVQDCAVTVDADGLWPATSTKARGLVPWRAIAGLRERTLLQRLELISERRAVLIRLEYQLAGFRRLRAMILTRLVEAEAPRSLPATFSKSVTYHAGVLGSAIVLAGLGAYLARGEPLVTVGLGLVAAILLGDYLTTVCRVVASPTSLRIEYPGRARTLQRSDIASIELGDQFDTGGAYRSEIRIVVKGAKRPVRVRDLGVSTAQMFVVLSRILGPGRTPRAMDWQGDTVAC